jgi:hypothetical protein
MLIRLNAIMRNFKEKETFPMLYVVDRISNRGDAVVLIVDILHDDKEYVEAAVKQILDYLSSHNIKVLGYELASYLVPFREVWRLVAVVAVNQ